MAFYLNILTTMHGQNHIKTYMWFRVENPVFLLVLLFFLPVPYTLFILSASVVALSSYLSWIIPTRIRYRSRPVCCVYQDKQDKDHRTRSYHHVSLRKLYQLRHILHNTSSLLQHGNIKIYCKIDLKIGTISKGRFVSYE